MTHVPLAEAVRVAGVKKGTIRRWVHDGRIARYSDGYDLAELLAAVDGRNQAAVMVRAGLSGGHGSALRHARREVA